MQLKNRLATVVLPPFEQTNTKHNKIGVRMRHIDMNADKLNTTHLDFTPQQRQGGLKHSKFVQTTKVKQNLKMSSTLRNRHPHLLKTLPKVQLNSSSI
jgi:hypothetical protein